MQFYLAPMEGLTGYVYRNAYHKYFPAADRYFTPFITNKKMSSRERNDILPEHNEGMTVIPQILTNQAEDFLSLTKELREYGYDTVNLNLGCPSGTVVAKRRGSGLLAWPNTLDAFLDEIFFVVRLPHLDQNAAWHNGYRRVGGSAYGLRQISARGTDHSSADSEGFLQIHTAHGVLPDSV